MLGRTGIDQHRQREARRCGEQRQNVTSRLPSNGRSRRFAQGDARMSEEHTASEGADELSESALDSVTGGIIIIGGQPIAQFSKSMGMASGELAQFAINGN
jgi:hypothetical protein